MENKHTHTDMHSWQEEKKHPLGEFKAGNEG